MGRTGKKPTIEENFEKLESMIEKLESPDVPLEESFKIYTEGMDILKICSEQLDMVEKKVLKLGGDGSLEEMESL